ncbi:MAG: hypothetical protein MPJ24_00185 [Pirellulaceae bacterium]|nr:hypothetical protein [Pirellulaceae bacterium]
MRKFVSKTILCLAAVALLALPLTRANAQDVELAGGVKPTMIVATASVDELLSDANYIATAVGNPESVMMAQFMLRGMINGVDTGKPVGAVLGFDGIEPVPFVMVPVSNLDAIMASVGQAGTVEFEELEENLYSLEIPPGETVYLTVDNGYALLATDLDVLENSSVSPEKLLSKMTEKHDIAVDIFVQNFPAEFKDQFLHEMKLGYENSIRFMSEEDRINSQAVMDTMFNNFERIFDELTRVSYAIGVDEDSTKTYLDVAVTALPGSEIDELIESSRSLQSDYLGFLVSDAAVTYNAVGKSAQNDIDNVVAMLDNVETQVLDQMEGELSGEDLLLAQGIVKKLLDVTKESVAQEKNDGGAALILKPGQFTFVAGAYTESGDKITDAVSDLFTLISEKGEGVPIDLSTFSDGGIDFHKMVVTLPELDEGRKVFGETVEVLIGNNNKSVYVGLGNECLPTLKKIISNPGLPTGAKELPTQFNISVVPILNFVAALDENPVMDAVAQQAEKYAGDDSLRLSADYIPNGVSIRLQIDEGIWKIIGEVAQLGQ